jgi:hypothetical protein
MSKWQSVLKARRLQKRVYDKYAPTIAGVLNDAMLNGIEGMEFGRLDIDPLYLRRLETAMKAMYREITRSAAEELVDVHKAGFQGLSTKASLDEFYDRIYQEFLDEFGSKKIVRVWETTRKQIRDIVAKGLKEGKSLEEIAEEIRKTSRNFTKLRSVVIARTETHGASMYASLKSAKRSTLPLVKEWVSVEDARTRDSGEGDGIVDEFDHRNMNGQKVGMDDPFQVPHKAGFTENLMFPGDPNGSAANVINCRCGMVYVTDDTGMWEEVDEGQATRPITPAEEDALPNETQRLLDRITKLKFIQENRATAFDGANEDFLKAVLAGGDLDYMILDEGGAYADFRGGLSMGKHVPGSERYDTVFRHELGHVLDLRMAQAREPGVRNHKLFASFEAIKEIEADHNDLRRQLSFKTINQDPVIEEQDWQIENEELSFKLIKQIMDEYDDKEKVIQTYVGDGITLDDVKEYYGFKPGADMDMDEVATFAVSYDGGDAYELLHAMPKAHYSAQSTEYRVPPRLAGPQDSYEASAGYDPDRRAGNFAFGHGQEYYEYGLNSPSRIPKDLKAEKYSGYASGQMFANWFDAYGDPNPVAYTVYKRLFPRTSKKFEEMVKAFVKEKGV